MMYCFSFEFASWQVLFLHFLMTQFELILETVMRLRAYILIW